MKNTSDIIKGTIFNNTEVTPNMLNTSARSYRVMVNVDCLSEEVKELIASNIGGNVTSANLTNERTFIYINVFSLSGELATIINCFADLCGSQTYYNIEVLYASDEEDELCDCATISSWQLELDVHTQAMIWDLILLQNEDIIDTAFFRKLKRCHKH